MYRFFPLAICKLNANIVVATVHVADTKHSFGNTMAIRTHMLEESVGSAGL